MRRFRALVTLLSRSQQNRALGTLTWDTVMAR